MFIINEDKSIYITRGDAALFAVTAVQDGQPYTFQPNDVVRFKVFEKKGCDTVVLQKDFFVNEACASVDIELLRADTKIGEIIHKPKDFWYEVELNPETYPQTIIGYDEDGAKSFRLLPEGKDLEPDEDEEQQGTSVYERVLALVGTMSEHGRQAAEDARNAAEDSREARASAESAEQSAADAEAVARSIREDAVNGVFTPQIGPNGNWMVNGNDTGIPASNANVGNILETTRTDLGENWVLCNGDLVPEGAYPELREVLPYDTDWKRLYEGNDYFRPMSETGFWYINANFNDSQPYNYKSAMVYDSNTGSTLKITCPTIADSAEYGMFGMTHDGKQFILGVYDKTGSKICLFTSTDLETWVECFQAAKDGSTAPYDITFDGTYILVLAAYNNSNSTYKTYVYSITPDTWTKKTLWDFTTSDSNKRYFRLCPYGLWSLTYDGETTAFIYNSGTTTQAFYYTASSCGGKFVFFNDRYVFTAEDNDDGAIHDTMVYDIVDKTSTTFYWRKAVGDSGGYYYLRGLKYNKNTNEWELNIDGGSGTYISYISADANPSDNTQYRFEKVAAHPTGLSMKNQRMGLDRSQMRYVSGAEMYVNNPNVKYLPTHDGDTYKYIYAGGADE